jgi:hypothetical protein
METFSSRFDNGNGKCHEAEFLTFASLNMVSVLCMGKKGTLISPGNGESFPGKKGYLTGENTRNQFKNDKHRKENLHFRRGWFR